MYQYFSGYRKLHLLDYQKVEAVPVYKPTLHHIEEDRYLQNI